MIKALWFVCCISMGWLVAQFLNAEMWFEGGLLFASWFVAIVCFGWNSLLEYRNGMSDAERIYGVNR